MRAGTHILNIAFVLRAMCSTLPPRSAVAYARCVGEPLLLLFATLLAPPKTGWANLGPKWLSRLRTVLDRAPRLGEVPLLAPNRPNR